MIKIVSLSVIVPMVIFFFFWLLTGFNNPANWHPFIAMLCGMFMLISFAISIVELKSKP
jgi:hypothetical protein